MNYNVLLKVSNLFVILTSYFGMNRKIEGLNKFINIGVGYAVELYENGNFFITRENFIGDQA